MELSQVYSVLSAAFVNRGREIGGRDGGTAIQSTRPILHFFINMPSATQSLRSLSFSTWWAELVVVFASLSWYQCFLAYLLTGGRSVHTYSSSSNNALVLP